MTFAEFCVAPDDLPSSNPRSRKGDPECGGDHWPLGI